MVNFQLRPSLLIFSQTCGKAFSQSNSSHSFWYFCGATPNISENSSLHSDPKLKIPFGNGQRKTKIFFAFGLQMVSKMYDLFLTNHYEVDFRSLKAMQFTTFWRLADQQITYFFRSTGTPAFQLSNNQNAQHVKAMRLVESLESRCSPEQCS